MVQEVFLDHRLEYFKSNVCQSLIEIYFFAQNFAMYKVGLMGWLSCRLFLFLPSRYLFINTNCAKWGFCSCIQMENCRVVSSVCDFCIIFVSCSFLKGNHPNWSYCQPKPHFQFGTIFVLSSWHHGEKVECRLLSCLGPTYRNANSESWRFFEQALIFLPLRASLLYWVFFLAGMT